eukprot:603525-Hanusia_phi.AAC.1
MQFLGVPGPHKPKALFRGSLLLQSRQLVSLVVSSSTNFASNLYRRIVSPEQEHSPPVSSPDDVLEEFLDLKLLLVDVAPSNSFERNCGCGKLSST